jgi:hypothetical protein
MPISSWNPFKNQLAADPQHGQIVPIAADQLINQAAQWNVASIEDTYRRLVQERNKQVSNVRYSTHEETFMNPLRMIAMRLRLKDGESMPFQAMNACQKSDGSYIVFVLHKDQPLVLEDSEALFPSDTLISQLHLLLK